MGKNEMGAGNMREIKFRVWNKKLKHFIIPWQNKEQYDDIDLTYSNSGKWYILGGEELFENKYSLQQYTGLKDKNDKEIYEGDIIEGPHDFGFGFFLKKGIVSFDVEKGSYRWEYWKIEEIQVIGNIFENPELLK